MKGGKDGEGKIERQRLREKENRKGIHGLNHVEPCEPWHGIWVLSMMGNYCSFENMRVRLSVGVSFPSLWLFM